MTVKRTTQLAVEVLASTAPVARVTQLGTEVIAAGSPVARVTQLAVEVLAPYTAGGGGDQYRQLVVAC